MVKNIIFDWSGTLSDDLTPVYRAAMRIFELHDEEPLTLDEFREKFELPYMNFYAKYLPDLSREDIDNLFFEHYDSIAYPELYPGVREMLQYCNSKGIKLAVFSTHDHEKLVKEAESFGIKDYFVQIMGSVQNKIFDIRKIVSQNGFVNSETIFIGDMVHDIEAGKYAGVKTVAVTWGYDTKNKLKLKNPDIVIDNISQIEKLI